jgi:hypothetical protein
MGYNLHSPNIIIVTESIKRWTGHAAPKAEMINPTFQSESKKG